MMNEVDIDGREKVKSQIIEVDGRKIEVFLKKYKNSYRPSIINYYTIHHKESIILYRILKTNTI